MEERRQFVRLDTRLDAKYTILPAGTMSTSVTKDISGGGICLFTDKVMEQGQQLQVSLTLPGREQPVNFTGEVAWCEAYEMIGQSSRQRAVEVGLRFLEISPQDQDAVMQHVILNFKPQPNVG